MNEMFLRATIPVVINSFEQKRYLQQMIERLRAEKFNNLIVIDQNSQDPLLLQYYSQISASNLCKVIRLTHNAGPRWFFQSELYRSSPELFFYTDPDLQWPEGLAPDFVTKFVGISAEYKSGKVGAALTLPAQDEIIEKKLNHQGKILSIREWENRFWERELEENVYEAAVDTTWHLVNKKYFSIYKFISGHRLAGRGFECQHLPWYKSEHRIDGDLIDYSKKSKWSVNI